LERVIPVEIEDLEPLAAGPRDDALPTEPTLGTSADIDALQPGTATALHESDDSAAPEDERGSDNA